MTLVEIQLQGRLASGFYSQKDRLVSSQDCSHQKRSAQAGPSGMGAAVLVAVGLIWTRPDPAISFPWTDKAVVVTPKSPSGQPQNSEACTAMVALPCI